MDTFTIKLPVSEADVELKTFITARERREIDNIYMTSAEFNAQGQTISQLKPEVINKAQDKAFELVVISINGNKENVVEQILNLRTPDYKHLQAHVQRITEGLELKKKE